MNQSVTSALINNSNYVLALDINYYYLPFCASVGVVGNILSFIILISSNLTKSTTCIYMAMIAVLDTFILLHEIFRNYSTIRATNDIVCKISSLLFYFPIHFNTLLIVAMTCERYVAVKYPLKSSVWITPTRTRKTIAGIAVFTFFINLHQAIVRQAVRNINTGQLHCLYSGETTMFYMTKIYPWIDAFIYSIFPLSSLCVLNFHIIRILGRSRSQFEDSANSGATNKLKQQRQITIMLILVSVAFMVFTVPIGCMLVIKFVWFPKTIEELGRHKLVRAIVNNLMFTNHAVNFLLYVVSGSRFRLEVWLFFNRLLCCDRRSGDLNPTPTTKKIYTSNLNTQSTSIDTNTS